MAMEELEEIEQDSLTETERHIYIITRAHARLKLVRVLEDEEALNEAAAYCEEKELGRYAGEAYYIEGAYRNLTGRDAEAMQQLKQAERAFDGEDVPAILIGMTYYKMGRISETEQLYAVAERYYEQAVPYLDSAALPLYAACGWRELGRTTPDSVVRREAFEKALQLSESLDTLTRLDIRYAALSKLDPQSPELIAISRYLCDSAGQSRYAYDLARHYLTEGCQESALVCRLHPRHRGELLPALLSHLLLLRLY